MMNMFNSLANPLSGMFSYNTPSSATAPFFPSVNSSLYNVPSNIYTQPPKVPQPGQVSMDPIMVIPGQGRVTDPQTLNNYVAAFNIPIAVGTPTNFTGPNITPNTTTPIAPTIVTPTISTPLIIPTYDNLNKTNVNNTTTTTIVTSNNPISTIDSTTHPENKTSNIIPVISSDNTKLYIYLGLGTLALIILMRN